MVTLEYDGGFRIMPNIPSMQDTYIKVNKNNESAYEQYKYDDNHYRDLISRKQYTEAYNYASQFHVSDPKKDHMRQLELDAMLNQGQELEAQYARVTNKNDMNAIDFYDSVFVNGGIANLNADNEYANKFKEAKKIIGGENSTELGLTFYTDKNSFLGFDNLARDNENTLANFMDKLGYSEEDLRNKGFRIIDNKDGSKELRFKKDNPLANYVLYNIDKPVNNYGDVPGAVWFTPIAQFLPDFHMADISSPLESTDALFGSGWRDTTLRGYDDRNRLVYEQNNKDNRDIYKQLEAYQSLIDSTKDVKSKYFGKSDIAKTYSTTVGRLMSDDIMALTEAYNNGTLDKTTEFFKRRDDEIGQVERGLELADFSKLGIYSNAINEVNTDNTISRISNTESSILKAYFNKIPKTKRIYGTMIGYEGAGLYVTIPAGALNEQELKQFKKDYNDDLKKTNLNLDREISFYVPNPSWCMQDINKSIISDTRTRAMNKLNSIQDYNYSYKGKNGIIITPDGYGNFVKKDRGRGIQETIGKDEAIYEMSKDMIISDLYNNFIYNYVDEHNTLGIYGTSSDRSQKYLDDLFALSMIAADELNPNQPYEDTYGNTIDFNINKDMNLLRNIIENNEYQGVSHKAKKKYDDLKDIYMQASRDAKAFMLYPTRNN